MFEKWTRTYVKTYVWKHILFCLVYWCIVAVCPVAGAMRSNVTTINVTTINVTTGASTEPIETWATSMMMMSSTPLPLVSCKAGEMRVASGGGGGSGTSGTCEPCVDGSYCPGDGMAYTCDNETCGEGMYESSACNATGDRVCSACSNETCGEGMYESSACNATADHVCAACSNETCGEGMYESSACNATADHVCAACPEGSYCPGNNAVVACGGVCAAGAYQSSACNATADRVCATCPAGSWCADSARTTCEATLPDSWAPAGSDASDDCKCKGISPTTTDVMVARTGWCVCYLSGGVVRCWGMGTSGCLGTGKTHKVHLASNAVAIDFGTTEKVTFLSGGYDHYCALFESFRIKCWGLGTSYQLGYGTNANRGDTLESVGAGWPFVDLGDGVLVSSVFAGYKSTCVVLLVDKRSTCWGQNEQNYGLGFGNGVIKAYYGMSLEEMRALPRHPFGGTGKEVLSVIGTYNNGYAIVRTISTGQTQLWGWGSSGRLLNPDGINTAVSVPKVLNIPTNFIPVKVYAPVHSAGNARLCALDTLGKILCWGSWSGGGDRTCRGGGWFYPTGDSMVVSNGGSDFVAVDLVISDGYQGAYGTTCAISNDGRMRCWGQYHSTSWRAPTLLSDLALIGNGGDTCTNDAYVPDFYFDDTGVTVRNAVFSAGGLSGVAALSDGTVRSWGSLATVASRLSGASVVYTVFNARPASLLPTLPALPAPTSSGAPVVMVAKTRQAVCYLSGGAVRCWGQGQYGVLGTGSTANVFPASAAVVIDFGTTEGVVKITGAWHHFCALFESGRIKCWGSGADYALGYGTSADRGGTAGSVGAGWPFVDLGDGVVVSDVFAGFRTTCVIFAADKTSTCWGSDGASVGTTYSWVGAYGTSPAEMRSLNRHNFGTGKEVVSIGTSVRQGYAIVRDTATGKNSVYGWGYNSWSLMPSNFANNYLIGFPTTVKLSLPADFDPVKLFCASHEDTNPRWCAVDAAGKMICAGYFVQGASRNCKNAGYFIDASFVNGEATPYVNFGTGFLFSSVAMSDSNLCAVSIDGRVRCAGAWYRLLWLEDLGTLVTAGQYIGKTSPSCKSDAYMPDFRVGPVIASGGLVIASYAASGVAVMRDGTIRSWGNSQATVYTSSVLALSGTATTYSSSNVYSSRPLPALPVPYVAPTVGCAPCPVGMWCDGVGNGYTCTACAVGQRVLSACTNLTDTVCAACTTGVECCNGVTSAAIPGGSYCSAQGTVTVCTTTCAVGTYLASNCTAVANTVCSACPAGSYCPGTNVAVACGGVCATGTYQSPACTASADRVCSACPVGMWCDGVGGYTCTACAVGQRVSSACTNLTDTVCVACTTGVECCNGVTSAAIPAGSYCSAQGAVTVCRTTCATGTYLTSNCTAVANTVCSACPAGSYCPGTNVAVACGGVCAAGTYQSSACTASADRVCSACPAGSWCSGGVRTVCASGYTSVAGSNSSLDCHCLAGTWLTNIRTQKVVMWSIADQPGGTTPLGGGVTYGLVVHLGNGFYGQKILFCTKTSTGQFGFSYANNEVWIGGVFTGSWVYKPGRFFYLMFDAGGNLIVTTSDNSFSYTYAKKWTTGTWPFAGGVDVVYTVENPVINKTYEKVPKPVLWSVADQPGDATYAFTVQLGDTFNGQKIIFEARSGQAILLVNYANNNVFSTAYSVAYTYKPGRIFYLTFNSVGDCVITSNDNSYSYTYAKKWTTDSWPLALGMDVVYTNMNPVVNKTYESASCQACPTSKVCRGDDYAYPCNVTCPIGLYKTAECNATSDITCEPCSKAKALGIYPMPSTCECDNGTYAVQTVSGSLECVNCSTCVRGAYVSKACKKDANTVCQFCPPSTFLEYISGIATCRICEEGSYCPGDGFPYMCPNGQRTDPTLGSSKNTSCVAPVCGNGILEGDEQCDDGGRFAGDGCNGYCRFEDSCKCANGTQWVCEVPSFEKSSCCKSLFNPVTKTYVCSCAGQVSDNTGYRILSNCLKQDIDECVNVEEPVCATNALCTNYDGTTDPEPYICTCPPGLLGDGVTRCDLFSYETSMTFTLGGLRMSDIDDATLLALLATQADLFPVDGNIQNDVTVTVEEYSDSTARRLQTTKPAYGVYLKIVVSATDAMAMQNFTQAVDTNGMTVLLADLYETEVAVKSYPQNVVKTVDSVLGAVNTIMSGFTVDGVIYNSTGMEWLITIRYVFDSPNTLTSLYVSKSDDPPYGATVRDSFYVSKHPCMKSMSVCCLNEYAAQYYVGGSLADDIASKVGTCNYHATHTHTLDLFSVEKNEDYLMQSLSSVQNSRVTRIDDNTLVLHINRIGLRNQVGMREAIVGGFKMDFFVGMSYFTLLPTNALATVASQVAVHVTSTDAVSFATTSEQDYSFIQYITMNLFQTKYVENMLVEHYMQFVKVGVVIPEGVRQNMATGLIPLKSIRFAVSQMPPDVDDTAAWVNPCYSNDDTGLMDDATSSLRGLYDMAEQQTCALQSVFCVNPAVEFLTTGFVEIWFPIGDNTINTNILQQSSQYSLYVYFDISIVQPNGKKVLTKFFSQAGLSTLAISRACETLSSVETMADVVEMDLDVGMVTSEADWATSVVSFEDLLDKTKKDKYLDTGLSVHATSAQSGLITLAVRGNQDMFASPLARKWHVEIEDLVTMHFLENSKYEEMLSLIAAGRAWTMVREAGTGYLEIAFTLAALEICRTETIPGDFTCAIQKSIYRRQVVKENAVHPLASGVGTNDEAATVSWLERNVLGSTDFARDFATKWTRTVRAHHNINDRYNKAWFVNPMYNWNVDSGSATSPEQSIFSLTDRTIIVAVLALEDENFAYGSGGGVRRRMLLQVQSGGVNDAGVVQQKLERIASSAQEETMPTIENSGVVADYEIARMVGIADRTWVKTGTMMQIHAPVWYTASDVRNEIQLRMNNRLASFSTGVDFVRVVQFMMTPSVVAMSSEGRRLLAAGDVVQWSGVVTTMLTRASVSSPSTTNVSSSVYMEWLRCALWLGNITTDRAGSPIPSCGVATGGDGEMMNGPPADFIEAFWIETCTNYSLPGTNCSDILQIMQNPVMNTPEPTPGSPSSTVVAFQVVIDFEDPLLTTNTLSPFDLRDIRVTVASKFGVSVSQVVLDNIGPPSRRLLNVRVIYNVMIDAGIVMYPEENGAVWLENTRKALEDALSDKGYNVNVALINKHLTSTTTAEKTLTTTTPPPLPEKEEHKKKKSGRLVMIVCIVVVVAVMLGICGCVFYYFYSSRGQVGFGKPGMSSVRVAYTQTRSKYRYSPLGAHGHR